MTTGACFIYDEGGVGTGTTASPNWQIITAVSGVRTNFVTSVPVNITTWYSFRIESNANDTEIYYYINDVLVRTETTNIPSGSTLIQPYISITKNTGTTNRGIAVDYLGLKIKLNNQR
jgi:thiamine kinase-like enzyme